MAKNETATEASTTEELGVAVAAAPHREPTAKELEQGAVLAHEAMYGYCRAIGHANVSRFEDSPAWQQEEARAFAAAVADGGFIESHEKPTENTKRLIADAALRAFFGSLPEG